MRTIRGKRDSLGKEEPDLRNLLMLRLEEIAQIRPSPILPLEFGSVQPRRRDGSPGNPRGEWTLFIAWSWRIEGKRRIWCGSWSDGARWPRVFSRLQGRTVTAIQLQGRLAAVYVTFSNGLHFGFDDDRRRRPSVESDLQAECPLAFGWRPCRQVVPRSRACGLHIVISICETGENQKSCR
jgi:hypothetical protein